MKLPALRRDSATALAQVQAGLAAAEAKLSRLGESRLAALDSGDVAKARRVDQEIATAFGDVAALKDREAILQRKVDVERQELDAERYRAAVMAVERALPARLKAAAEFEESLAAVTSAAKKFQAKTRAVFADWPDDIDRPPAAYLSSENSIADALRRFVGGYDLLLIDRITKRKHEADFLAAVLEGRILSVDGPVGRENDQVLHYLHHFHDPAPVEDDLESATADDESEEAA